jgi:hypothetical protein
MGRQEKGHQGGGEEEGAVLPNRGGDCSAGVTGAQR